MPLLDFTRLNQVCLDGSKGSASIELPEIQESHEAVLMVRLAGSMLRDNQQFSC